MRERWRRCIFANDRNDRPRMVLFRDASKNKLSRANDIDSYAAYLDAVLGS